jgi:hypothetical protein
VSALDTLLRSIALKYGFRPRGPGEGLARYRAALIEYVVVRDYAAAHEARVGRRQAEWSPVEAQAFEAHLRARRPPPIDDDADFSGLPMLHAGHYACTEPALLELADRGLAATMAHRQANPTRELAIIAGVLLTNGEHLVTLVSRGDRIALLKWLARNHPVFGFTLVFDAFIHTLEKHPVTGETTKAVTRDAITMHIGTRERRIVKTRPYAVVNGRTVFHDPLPDIDSRAPQGELEDCYAEIFVSVPTPARPQ